LEKSFVAALSRLFILLLMIARVIWWRWEQKKLKIFVGDVKRRGGEFEGNVAADVDEEFENQRGSGKLASKFPSNPFKFQN
jgi:hypothetical protein